MYGIGDMSPLYRCQDGSLVPYSSQCSEFGGQSANANADPLPQIQAQIDTLFQWPGGTGPGHSADMPSCDVESIAPCTGEGFTSWLNRNSGKVALAGAGIFALMLFAKAGR